MPSRSEVQWAIKPRLEEWADVASYDPPGVGAEPPAEGPTDSEAIVARGAAEIERRGWDRVQLRRPTTPRASSAIAVAPAQRPRVVGLALGHAVSRTGLTARGRR